MEYINALAKINLLIDDYYGKAGRGDFDTEDMRIVLITEIDYILEKVKIPKNILVLEQLNIDEEQ